MGELNQNKKILLTGATGYVGGRLLPLLLKKGYSVRCMARHPERLTQAESKVEKVAGDVLKKENLKTAFEGIHTAYYLIHSLSSGKDFEELEYQSAHNFAQAAQAAGIKKIIYLGGLGSEKKSLSKHLSSRQEVGEILRNSGIPIIEFRASVILGSGSLSFEMVRALVERLPIMTTPRWVRTPTQPIAIEDVLSYLLLAAQEDFPQSRIFEIGGASVVTYGEIMQEYARQRGLRRSLIPVPVLSPGLSSLWLSLVTPLYAKVGKKLIEGIRNPTLVKDPSALREFPIRPMGLSQAIERALKKEDQEFTQSHWTDALSSVDRSQWGGIRVKSRLIDTKQKSVSVPPEKAFLPIQSIGGKNGWYYANSLWRLRGFLDSLIGGVGLRRGRRDPINLKVGDALDFWRVESFAPPHKLLLKAEMKVPGRAWLEFKVESQGLGSLIQQTALFDPKGLSGMLYWYLLYPIHQKIFQGMLDKIAEEAEELK
ncbi:MAG: SDR family oxidoreductase [Deltaproteobacteria bacterium]|nr:SDR family oxidoreductase [Deltaproteobacteria bacterium]